MKLFAVLIMLLMSLAAAWPGQAHDWYPLACCSDKDCWKSAPGKVTPTERGWRIESTGEIVPYDDRRVKPTPPEGGTDFHICHRGGDPKASVLCLFVPQGIS